MSTSAEVPPQPAPDPDSAEFWRGLQEGRLALCRCERCRRWLQPPLERCPSCWGQTSFETITGSGSVHSFIVVHQPAIPGYRDRLPYTVALVELDQQTGLRLPGRLVDIDPADVRVGQRVKAAIEHLPGGTFHVAVFRPA